MKGGSILKAVPSATVVCVPVSRYPKKRAMETDYENSSDESGPLIDPDDIDSCDQSEVSKKTNLLSEFSA